MEASDPLLRCIRPPYSMGDTAYQFAATKVLDADPGRHLVMGDPVLGASVLQAAVSGLPAAITHEPRG